MSYFLYKNKKVYYQIKGSGVPLIIVHGNSVSSKMHTSLANKLKKTFRVISIDLPGHGKSERIEKWPSDFWWENAFAVYELIRHLNLKSVNLLGYSGGAQIVLNLALEHPEIVSKVIADSFEGETSVSSFAQNIFEDREKSKKNFIVRIFWFLMHGFDWEKVVDNDSKSIFEHNNQIKDFFYKDLSGIKCPLLLTGSKEDEYVDDFYVFYNPILKKIPNAKFILYEKGKHPASLTAGGKVIKDIIEFINKNSNTD